VGLLLLALGIFLSRALKTGWLTYLAFCVALIVEEYLVILYEMGIRAPYVYLSSTDNLVVYGVGASGMLFACGFYRLLGNKKRQAGPGAGRKNR
jgi:hypothetical protein